MKRRTIREATRKWLATFDQIPGAIIGKLGVRDEAVLLYDSDDFRLVASPSVRCLECGELYEGELSLPELHQREAAGRGVACAACRDNEGDAWEMGRPLYAFPCAWSTLFLPRSGSDQAWLGGCRGQVAALGLHVFESDELGFILGIDGAGFDFYDAFWIPLYRLRARWYCEAA